MTQELIWGKSGSPHIDGNDIGTINLAMRGIGNYVLDYKDKLKATVASANKITIGTGVMSFEGRDIIISVAETVTIKSGSQGMKRNDIICEHYHRDTSTGVETTNLVAINGTPASSNPKDPTIPSGTILGGATDAYMPLWRIPLDGITVGTPVQLFEILTPLKTVGDSVTHMYSWQKFTFKFENTSSFQPIPYGGGSDLLWNPILRLIVVRLASFKSSVGTKEYSVYLPDSGTFKPSKNIGLGQAELENYTGRGVELTLTTKGRIMVGPELSSGDVVRPLGSYVVPVPEDVQVTVSAG